MDAHEWDTRYSATETMWSYEPNMFLVPRVEGLRPGRALDLGCGEGRNALWLASRGWEVTAVDFSQVAVDRGESWAEQRGLGVDFQVADVIEYEPEPGAFDLVIVFYLQLPHDEVRQVLALAVRALAPGGTLLVVAHDLDNLERGYGGPTTADVLYTSELVTDAIVGLQIIEAGCANRPISTSEGERTAIDTLVLARRVTEDR
jgi:SAM-dependent methyltransferase